MKDFHVHHHLDACGSAEMTFPNIERACVELGIDEVAVVKHYSSRMPNGERDWITWHVQGGDRLDAFLDEYKAYKPEQVIFHSGVETELMNDKGDINILVEDQNKVDIVQLSIHFMIDTERLPMDLMLYPNLSFCPEHNNDEGRRIVSQWKERVDAVGAEYLIEATVNGYINAIKRYPKVRSLSHMGDGMNHLRTYLADVDSVSADKKVEMFEPLMKLMHENGVFWEMTAGRAEKAIIRRAHEMGVMLTCTADAHQLYEGWAPLKNHILAEQNLRKILYK